MRRSRSLVDDQLAGGFVDEALGTVFGRINFLGRLLDAGGRLQLLAARPWTVVVVAEKR